MQGAFTSYLKPKESKEKRENSKDPPPRWYRYYRCCHTSINQWENFLTVTTLVSSLFQVELYCHSATCVDIQCPPLILAPLINMSKGGCENKSALFILLIFHSKKFTKFQPIIEVKQLKVGRKSHCEITVFLQWMLATIIGTPRNSYE